MLRAPQLVVFERGIWRTVIALHFPPVCPGVSLSHLCKVLVNEFIEFLATGHQECMCRVEEEWEL